MDRTWMFQIPYRILPAPLSQASLSTEAPLAWWSSRLHEKLTTIPTQVSFGPRQPVQYELVGLGMSRRKPHDWGGLTCGSTSRLSPEQMILRWGMEGR